PDPSPPHPCHWPGPVVACLPLHFRLALPGFWPTVPGRSVREWPSEQSALRQSCAPWPGFRRRRGFPVDTPASADPLVLSCRPGRRQNLRCAVLPPNALVLPVWTTPAPARGGP